MKKYIIIAVILILAGCKSTGIYYWGDYSKSFYDYTINPSYDSREEYEKTLIDIIQKSGEKNKKVPPGVYFDLAMLKVKDGKIGKATEYFNLEQSTYPESTQIVQSVLQQLKRNNEKT